MDGWIERGRFPVAIRISRFWVEKEGLGYEFHLRDFILVKGTLGMKIFYESIGALLSYENDELLKIFERERWKEE